MLVGWDRTRKELESLKTLLMGHISRLQKYIHLGDVIDRLDNEASLPPLNPAQVDKLRRLTLVSLASESHVYSQSFWV